MTLMLSTFDGLILTDLSPSIAQHWLRSLFVLVAPAVRMAEMDLDEDRALVEMDLDEDRALERARP
jgi:hypothetical protein